MAGDRYDVVVVGAGPAGSMAAKAAAEHGASVLLLERDPVVGVPVRCGEGIALHNLRRFFPEDLRWCAARIQGMVMYAPDGTAVPVESAEIGVILERALFDRWLAENAAAAGADVLTRADVDGLLQEDGRVAGVHYTRFGRSHTARAAVVVGADGVESRVGRWAGIRTQISASDMESAYQMILAGLDYDYTRCHFFFGNRVAPGGYVWVFPKGQSTASVGIGVCARMAGPGEAYRLLTDFIARRFGRPAIVGEMAGGVPVAKPLRDPVRNGLILAGDAARHCNPLTGGGIATAMIAGNHAGRVAAEAVHTGDTSAFGLRKYLELIEDDIVKPHKRAYRLAEGVSRLTDEMINWTAHEVLSLPEGQRNLRNIFLKGLSSQPKLMVDIIRAFA